MKQLIGYLGLIALACVIAVTVYVGVAIYSLANPKGGENDYSADVRAAARKGMSLDDYCDLKRQTAQNPSGNTGGGWDEPLSAKNLALSSDPKARCRN